MSPAKVRRTISLAADLDGKLKKLGRKINVSEVCSEALRREVRELEHQEDDSRGVVEAIERLRAERLALTKTMRKKGFVFGADWIKGEAKLAEIRELVAIYARHRTDYAKACDKAKLAKRSAPSEAEHVTRFALDFVTSHVDYAHVDFPDDLAPDEFHRQSALFVLGFMEGVQDLWDRMRHEVDTD